MRKLQNYARVGEGVGVRVAVGEGEVIGVPVGTGVAVGTSPPLRKGCGYVYSLS